MEGGKNIKGERIKQFSQGPEQIECLSSVTNSWVTEGSKQFISPHSISSGMLWLCYPLTHSISGKLLKTFIFSKASLFLDLDWNHIPYHKRMLFQALRILHFQATTSYWLFETYNKCFFHRTGIWWWLQPGAPLKLKNWYLKRGNLDISRFRKLNLELSTFVPSVIKQTLLKAESITMGLVHVKKILKVQCETNCTADTLA